MRVMDSLEAGQNVPYGRSFKSTLNMTPYTMLGIWIWGETAILQ
jgi:hypothetical protein